MTSQLLQMNPYQAVQQPVPASGDERLKALLAWALLSPSPHNTLPWAWSVIDGVIELRRDNARLLTVSDPDGRELVIGCGCALEHLLLRLGVEGDPVSLELLPEGPESELLARVRVGSGEPYHSQPELVAQMPLRRTNRTAYHGAPMSAKERESLIEAAGNFDVKLRWVDEVPTRAAVVELIMQSDREQMANPDFRKELSHWMRPEHSHQMDGMEADLLGQHGVAAYVAPIVVRTFDVGKQQAAKDSQLTEGSPDLFVFETAKDDQAAWLATGRALAHVTLGAMHLGRASAYMNQPCEVPSSRTKLCKVLATTDSPQLVLRVGLADETHAALRFPVADVLGDSSSN